MHKRTTTSWLGKNEKVCSGNAIAQQKDAAQSSKARKVIHLIFQPGVAIEIPVSFGPASQRCDRVQAFSTNSPGA